MQGRLQIELLGEIRLLIGEQIITRFSTQKVAAMLAYLALQSPASVPRESVIEMFWPDQEPGAGRNSLSVALNALRRQLEPVGVRAGSILVTDRSMVRLNPDAFATDVVEFERLLKVAETDPQRRRDHLSAAVALYRGDFAQGHYYDWAVREQVRLQLLYTEALLTLCAELEQAGVHAMALEMALKAISVDPFSERAYRAAIRLHVATGQPAHALEAARRLEQTYREEFGSEPSEMTRRFLVRLRQDPRSLLTASPGADPATRAAGTLSMGPQPPALPAQKTQAPHSPAVPQEGGFPPILPLRLTRLFGRTQEIEEVATLLHPEQGEGFRLVTLTGAGGTGKTRLSQEIGAALAPRFPGRICFVPLADLRDANEIPMAILNALSVRNLAETEPFVQAVDTLKYHPTLLILDNLEQLLASNVAPVSRPQTGDATGVIYRLLEQAPSLVCLCTSRRRLGIEGEREYRVGALRLPQVHATAEQLASAPSVQLYVDRARAVRADFQLTAGNAATVGELCRRLEGTPLAIELAAAWVRTLPPRPMLERLENRLALPAARYDDVPARHRSLAAVLDWSYALLTPPQQRFFMQLALFSGGWTLPAAVAVCAEPAALELTEALLGASLAYEDQEGTDPRFRCLETVRQYARERLKESGEQAEAFRRFRDYYCKLAERAEAALEGPEQKQWLDLLRDEYANLCAAQEIDAADTAGGEAGLCMTSSLWRYWFTRGQHREGVARLTMALAHPGASRFPRWRMLALLRRGNLLTHLKAYAEADLLYTQVLALAEELGDLERKAAVLNNRAILQTHLGNYTTADQLGMEALALSRSCGNRKGEGINLGTLGVAAQKRGDWPVARRRLEACVAIFRELGHRYLVAVNSLNLAAVALGESDHEAARHGIQECLELCADLEASALLISALNTLAVYLAQAQGWQQAARLYGAAAGLSERLDLPQAENAANLPADVASVRAVLSEAEFVAEFAAGHALSLADAVAYALACSA
jgi:predicted ATPase/DNA-binding SARP family transcriptional activator